MPVDRRRPSRCCVQGALPILPPAASPLPPSTFRQWQQAQWQAPTEQESLQKADQIRRGKGRAGQGELNARGSRLLQAAHDAMYQDR